MAKTNAELEQDIKDLEKRVKDLEDRETARDTELKKKSKKDD